MKNNQELKSGFVSVLGRANVGKSTFINKVVGSKISAISDKAQTTREKIRAIYNDDESQIIFVDTPGLHMPKHKLGEFMIKSAEQGSKESDIKIYMIDDKFAVSRKDDLFEKHVINSKEETIIVVNKTDKIPLEKFAKILEYLESIDNVQKVFSCCAKDNIGVKEIIDYIKAELEYGPRYYPSDMDTDLEDEKIISEIIREKILMYLDEEIPHGVAVSLDKYRKRENADIVDIYATIICEKKSHKAILIGKKGRKLKGIGISARKEIEEILAMKVYLNLWIKVKDRWRDNPSELKRQGFDLSQV